MKIENMTLKQIKERCVSKKTCDKCELWEMCFMATAQEPYKWNLEREVQDES